MTNKVATMMIIYLSSIILFPCVSGLLVVRHQPLRTIFGAQRCQSSSLKSAVTFQSELDGLDLGGCHGMLHASGIRQLSDIKALTSSMMVDMRTSDKDRTNLELVADSLRGCDIAVPQLSSALHGAFSRRSLAFSPGSGIHVPKHDFCMEVVSEEHDVFKGRLFTEEQCLQINRMAEYHAYSTQHDDGWTNKVYTLTAQHLLCKDVPGLSSMIKDVFQQLFRDLYLLLQGRICPGTICFENSGEPHLVKYSGLAKGTELHKDNSEYVYITVNCMLSDTQDFEGGGTYIRALDRTIQLNQGEMLIHLGDLEHAGEEINSGVRRLLIAFLACEWEDEELNKLKVEEGRDYIHPTLEPNALLF